MKSEAVRRLLDEKTFNKLKTKINQTAHYYFKKNAERSFSSSLKNIEL